MQKVVELQTQSCPLCGIEIVECPMLKKRGHLKPFVSTCNCIAGCQGSVELGKPGILFCELPDEVKDTS